MSAVHRYATDVAAAWNRFWFSARSPELLCLLRIVVGGLALVYLLTFSAGLVRWFGAQGLLPAETVRQLTGAAAEGPLAYRWSYLYWVETPGMLWAVHGLGLLAAGCFTVGYRTRWTGPATLIVVLSYVHRAPMIAGLWEPVLVMLLLYLCLAPSGACWSIDAWRTSVVRPLRPSVWANVALRLMQIHLSAFYLLAGTMKLAGDTWWSGEAVWWLMAHTESRLIDFTAWPLPMLAINLLTHLMVWYELAFGVLIWNRLARPVLLVLAVPFWIFMALLTGHLGYAATMLAAGMCFLPRELWPRYAPSA